MNSVALVSNPVLVSFIIAYPYSISSKRLTEANKILFFIEVESGEKIFLFAKVLFVSKPEASEMDIIG